MDKLTEQWRNGTLEDGFYYVKENNEVFISPCSKHYLLSVLKDCEVLAHVPTYNQFADLSKKVNQFSQLVKKVERLQAENKKLKERLSDADETIKDIRDVIRKGEFPCDACGYSMECEGCWCGDLADSYLKKWGVK